MPTYNGTPYNTADAPYVLPPDQGVAQRRAGVSDFFNRLIAGARGKTDFTSEQYPPSVNFLLKGLQKFNAGVTGNPWIDKVTGGAWDWAFTPEVEQNKQQAAAAAGAPAQPFIDIEKLRRPMAPVGDKPITMFEMPVPNMPQPPIDSPFQMSESPQLQPFVQAQPPMPSMPAPPVEQVGPDYSEFNSWMDKAQPVKSDVDWEKQKRLEAFAGLSHGAANWDPRRGWGGLLAGSFDGVAQGVLDNRKNELNANDEFTKEMQRFASVRAQQSLAKAGDRADLTNSNADRRTNYENDVVSRRDKYKTDLFNNESGNAQRRNTAENTNLANNYEVTQKNLAAVHESNVVNGQNRYKAAVEKAQRESPQIESITKDGAVVVTTEGGKRILKYQPFKTSAGSEDLKKIETRYGKDSGVYKMHKAKDMLESGDDISLAKSMVEEAVQNGYAKGVFGDAFEAAREEVEQNMLTQPGSKEYPAEFARMMTGALIRHMDLANPELIKAFAANGNIEARYLLSGEEDGVGDQGR